MYLPLLLISMMVNINVCLGYICEGDEVCINLSVAAVFTELICSGHASCAGSQFTLTCNEEKCKVFCIGHEACSSMMADMDKVESIECVGFEACERSELALLVSQDFAVKCDGPKACYMTELVAEFDESVKQGAIMKGVDCEGARACYQASLTMHRVENVKCQQFESCGRASYQLVNVAPGFQFHADGAHSFYRGTLDLLFSGAPLPYPQADVLIAEPIGRTPSPTTASPTTPAPTTPAPTTAVPTTASPTYPFDLDIGIDQIVCEGSEACLNAVINIDNESGELLVIEELKCIGWEACSNLVIDVLNGEATIKKCICDAPHPYSCTCAQGLEICQEIEGEWSQQGTDYYSCTS